MQTRILEQLKRMIVLSLIFVLGTALNSVAQGYEIKVKFHHLQDTSVYLGYHFGDRKFVKDTLFLNNKGEGTFQGKEPLPGGVYLLVMPNMRYLEFLVDDSQHFTIETDTTDFLNTMHFKGSQINTDFLNYQAKLVKLNSELQQLSMAERRYQQVPDSVKHIASEIEAINDQTRVLNKEIIESHPDSFLSHLVQAITPPLVPDFEIDPASSNPDSLRWIKSYQYLRDHYFDDVDFGDERLLRTPVIYNRLEQYFNNILIQTPDSLIPQVDKVIAASKANDDVYQYVVVSLLNHFQRATVMGLDGVYVHIAKKYYLSGLTPWSDSTFLSGLKERVDKIEPNLIGKKAHDLKMETITGEWVDLDELNARYTILYFWEPNCGHCKKFTPLLYNDIYQKYRDKGLDVFAVYIYDNREEWEKYINDHGYDWINVWDPKQLTYFRFYYDVYSTPTIYILDSQKKIIAKRLLDIETLEKFMARLYRE